MCKNKKWKAQKFKGNKIEENLAKIQLLVDVITLSLQNLNNIYVSHQLLPIINGMRDKHSLISMKGR